MEQNKGRKNRSLATIIGCNSTILFNRFALWAFSYDMESGSFTDLRYQKGRDGLLEEYSRLNKKALRYRLPKIAEAYIRLGKEERAREVLEEIENL